MTPERYQQIDELFQAALKQKPAERASFLDQVCTDDAALRSELESLISSHDEGLSFIDEPAFDVAGGLLVDDEPQLAAGNRIDRYEIIKLIGSGGMGEVYLAHDQKLNRRIALKLLPSVFGLNDRRLERFQQEARAASALNHPNIITIHEVGHVEERHFIATEFVEGETLRERLRRSLLILTEVLDIAIQICGALAAAHRAGIVHRDIKPENIMLRDDGYVKVLDFGLAKLTDQLDRGLHAEAAERTDASSGLVMGTVKYMSPEQARGDMVDLRSDIFSFGVVLYEMIAGKAPFAGETPAKLIAAISAQEPPPLFNIPDDLQLLVSKALHKESETRYQTIEDVLNDLKKVRQYKLGLTPSASLQQENGSRVSTTLDAHGSNLTARPQIFDSDPRLQTTAVVIVAAFCFCVGLIVWLTYGGGRSRRSSSTPQNISLARVTTSDKTSGAVISPDGKSIAFIAPANGRDAVWIRDLTDNSSRQIPLPGDIYGGMSFSPDGTDLYYFAPISDVKNSGASVLYKIPVAGGVPTKVLSGNINRHMTFSPDGKRFAYVVDTNDENGESSVWIANSDGTDEKQLAVRKFPSMYAEVAWSPDGNRIACTGYKKVGDRTYTDLIGLGVNDGVETPIPSTQTWGDIGDIAWLSDGGGLLMTARRRPGDPLQIWLLDPDGEARRITTDLSDYGGVNLSADSTRLVTTQNGMVMNIWSQPANEPDHSVQITSGMTTGDGLSGVAWTPDGRIVYSSSASGQPDIWIMDADGKNSKQLTVGMGSDRFALAVSPDGRYILFSSFKGGDGHANIWRVDIDGSDARQLTFGNGIEINATCSPDSKWVYYWTAGTDNRWKVPIDGGDPVQLTGPYRNVLDFSSDGTMQAYLVAGQQGKPEVGVIRSADERPVTVLEDVANAPRIRWAPDGRAITYFDGANVFARPLSGEPAKQLTKFRSDLNFSCLAWSPDGEHLAVARAAKITNVVLIKDFR